MVKQVPLQNFFNKREILYLQGVAAKIGLTEINNQISCTASKVRKTLGKVIDVQENDQVAFPIVITILSPFFNATVYQGEEAYPFLDLYNRLQVSTPPPHLYNDVSTEIINMINGFPPKTQPFLVESGLWEQNVGLGLKTKRRLNLKKEEIQFNYNV